MWDGGVSFYFFCAMFLFTISLSIPCAPMSCQAVFSFVWLFVRHFFFTWNNFSSMVSARAYSCWCFYFYCCFCWSIACGWVVQGIVCVIQIHLQLYTYNTYYTLWSLRLTMKISNMITIRRTRVQNEGGTCDRHRRRGDRKKSVCHKGSVELCTHACIFSTIHKKKSYEIHLKKSSTQRQPHTLQPKKHIYCSHGAKKQQRKACFTFSCFLFSLLFSHKSVKRIELKISYIKMTVCRLNANWLAKHTLV